MRVLSKKLHLVILFKSLKVKESTFSSNIVLSHEWRRGVYRSKKGIWCRIGKCWVQSARKGMIVEPAKWKS